MPNTKYQIRNRLLEVVGEYSEEDILKRIAAGRFSGEEQVSLEPFTDWQKLASHPKFYDAFIRRLYSDKYPSSDGGDSSPKAKQSAPLSLQKHETRRPSTPSGVPSEKEDPGKTHQNRIDPQNTIHQSDIDALFSEVAQTPDELEVPSPLAGKTDLILMDPVRDLLSEPVDEPPPERLPPIEKPAAKGGVGAQRPRSRILMLALVAGLGLLWLFGGDAPSTPVTDSPPVAAEPILGNLTPSEERAATLLDEAAALMAQDTLLFYNGAAEVLEEALAIDDSNTAIISALAIALARTATGPDEAERLRPDLTRLLERGRSKDPHSSELYRAEAILEQAAGRLENAKTAALKAAETDPVAAANLLLIGELHEASGSLGEARAVLLEAVRAEPRGVRARYQLARAYLESGNLDGAQQQGLEALKLNPLHPETYFVLGEIAARRNQFKEARGLLETCGRLARFTLAATAGRAYRRLGDLHELAGNRSEAANSYQLAYYYLKGGDPDLKGKVKGLNTDPEALRKMAVQTEYRGPYFDEQASGLLSQGKTEEAVRFFQAAQLLDPKDGLALIRLGEVMEKTAASYEDFRRVMSYYQRAIDRDPTEAMGYIKLGLLESEQYNFERGYKLLSQALALAPESEKPYVALGKHFYKRQDYNEALNQFLKAAKINPSDSETLYYAGMLRLVYKKDGARDAQRFFSQAYTIDPRNYDALLEWLKLKVVNHEKNFAVKFVRNLIAAEPNNPMLHWVLGSIYAENKEHRRAIGYFHKSLDLDNRQSKVRMSLAKSLEAVGELEKAVAEFRLASLLDRRNSEGFYRAADLLFQMKSYLQAEEVLKFLVGVTPNYPGVHRYLSRIHQLRNQRDAAVEAMRLEVANNPTNYKFVLELSELLLEYQKMDEAIAELKKVTSLPSLAQAPEYKSEKTRAYLLLARAYRAKNQAESAEGAIKLALGLDSEDPELHRELGYVYYLMQRDKEGVQAFEFYLKRSPAARDAATIRGLIKKMVIEE